MRLNMLPFSIRKIVNEYYLFKEKKQQKPKPKPKQVKRELIFKFFAK